MPKVQPKVTLLSHTPNPEKTVASAAKLCYSSASLGDLMDNLTEEKASDFVQMLAEIGHESPIEHASFTFGIEGVSRAFLAQITRHRMASYSVQSQRYVREKAFDYVLPPEIEADDEALSEFEEAMEAAQESYDRIAAILKKRRAAALVAEGMEEKEAAKKAEKLAIEDARFVLPNACDTKMIVTMNARSLYNFFAHRCCNRAQWEIREVADQMLALVSAVAPTLFSGAGPSCCRGGCREGKMSCGKPQEVRGHIAKLKQGGRA
ncbi:FAD-dependent thymidylate synthase [Anaerotruncus massiliensis (ex Togo et al. 2019)]|uniref:FAD-dependent thymidylate synthase n=1 Tax=Anaerotruncus massiliensis (ex Togo et al. 2019) TaxID=1673720 RepID=UPI0027B9C307|nr:FAD-dependent thymidylate synthase [Anaerotruncus massiliensis (ex Togo et al. 2019)]